MSFPAKPPSLLWLIVLLPIGLVGGWWLGGQEAAARWTATEIPVQRQSIAGNPYVKIGSGPSWIAAQETSQRDLAKLDGSGPKTDLPASLSLDEARDYAARMTSHYPGTFRLPRPDEWEAAARGGLRGQAYPWGSHPPTAKQASLDREGPASVKRGIANPIGLIHMAGNVFEWCNDGSARGGAWSERDPTMLRIDKVIQPKPDYKDSDIGCRLVWEADAET